MAFFATVSTAVPGGYVYVLQAASIRNISGVGANTNIYVRSGTDFVSIAFKASVVASEPLLAVGHWVLKATDTVRMTMDGAAADDVIEAGVWGYMMKVAE